MLKILLGLGSIALTVLLYLIPGQEGVSYAIGPLAVAGIGVGLNAVGGLLKGGQKGPQLPKEVMDLLYKNAKLDRSNMFVPDQTAFTASINAQIADILAQIAPGMEAFNADRAARGTFSSGEATTQAYRTVYAPIARAATSAATQGAVGYEQLAQRGRIAGDTANQNALAILSGNAPRTIEQDFGDILGGLLEEGGAFATQLGLLKQLGLV